MFMTTTTMPNVKMSNMPARLSMTAKTSVDKPKIMASVAAIERRSFQMFITFSEWYGDPYNPFSKSMQKIA